MRQANDDPAPARLRISEHALERFIERVRPGLPKPAALREMRALAACATESATAPAWAGGDPGERYLLLGDVCFACSDDTVTTVMTAAGERDAFVEGRVRQYRRRSRRHAQARQRSLGYAGRSAAGHSFRSEQRARQAPSVHDFDTER